jgi:hypothetical protein
MARNCSGCSNLTLARVLSTGVLAHFAFFAIVQTGIKIGPFGAGYD